MATTAYIATKDAWTAVSSGQSNVLATWAADGPVLVHLATSAPAANAPGHPVRTDRKGGIGQFTLSGVSGVNVYVKSADPGGNDIPLQVSAF